MADTQRSLGGVGQREAGASPHTLVIWNYIDSHPGVNTIDLQTKALELDWIDRGYAHRWYVGELNRKRGTRRPSARAAVSDIASTRSDVAVRSVMRKTLSLMRRDGSVRRDESDGYYALRRPRTTGQVQARVRPRDEVMAGIVLAEVRRQLLAFGIDHLEQTYARVPLETRRLLAKWLRASQLVELPADGD